MSKARHHERVIVYPCWQNCRPVALAMLACVLLAAPRSLAGTGELGTVLLDRSAPPPPGELWPEAAQRTRAELKAVGLSVVEIDVPDFDPSKPAEALGRMARKHRAVAGVRLVRFTTPPGVDIWLVDEVTGKTSLRHVSTHNLPSSEAVAVVALAVVELLNASLLELRAAHRPRGSAAPTEAVFRMVDSSLEEPAERYRFAVRGGAAVIGSPGGLGLMVGPTLALGWALHPRFLLEAEFLVTATQSQLEGRAGEAQVGVGIGRLQLLLRGSEAARLQPMVGIGAGVLFAWANGEARETYRAESDVTAVALPSAVLALAMRVSSALRVRLALNAGFAVPALSTTLAGEESATAGRPLVDGTVALEWVFGNAERALP